MRNRRGEAVCLRAGASRLSWAIGWRATGWSAVGLTALLSWLAAGCAAGDADSSSEEGRKSEPGPRSSNRGGEGGSAKEQGDGTGGAPPEVKVEKTFEAPVATTRHIWSANPKTGRVARIDATTFQIETVQSGDGPRYLAAVPGAEDRVLVVNSGANDAALLTATQSGIAVRRYGLHEGANAWSVSSDGHWAIAWSDISRYAAALGAKVRDVDARLGFQQVSVVDLAAASDDAGATVDAPRIAVGYRPTQIVFAQSGSAAYAITADGVTVIDLSEPGRPKFLRNTRYACQPPFGLQGKQGDGRRTGDVPSSDGGGADADGAVDAGGGAGPDGSLEPDSGGGLEPDAGGDVARLEQVPDGASTDRTEDAAVDADSEAGWDPCGQLPAEGPTAAPDVSITPEGRYAVVRREGSAVLDIVDLQSGSHSLITLSGAITDASLSADGTKAIAVVRDTSEVAVFTVPGSSAAPGSYADWRLAGQTIGRGIITKHNQSALLFTTALPVQRLVVLPLQASSVPHAIDLNAPVYAVFPTPDDAHAIVLHPTDDQSDTVAGAFSIVPLAIDRTPVIVATEAPPQQVAISPEGIKALVSTTDGKSKHVAYVARMPELQVDDYDLATKPTAVGVVASMGYVSQEHSEGRVTFIDLSRPAGLAHTITGFELAASIVQWPARDGGSR